MTSREISNKVESEIVNLLKNQRISYIIHEMEKKRCRVIEILNDSGVILKPNDSRRMSYRLNDIDSDCHKACHLHIVSEDEIKENDWIYADGGTWNGTITQCTQTPITECWKKIIATTDDKLWHSASDKYGQGCALIPKSFIKEYCKKDGINEVEVEYEDKRTNDSPTGYRFEVKVNPRHEIIIHPIEEKLYTREEVEQMLHDIVNDSHCKPERIVQPNSNKCAEFVLNWIKKRL